MDLFEYAKSKTLDQRISTGFPGCARLPWMKSSGQQHIVGKDTLLYRAIKGRQADLSYLLRPSRNTAKTTLAKVIANTTSASFTHEQCDSRRLRKTWKTVAKEEAHATVLACTATKTIQIPILTSIHRFNKGQQDYLLPFVEDGTIILIGATTENPYFEVNASSPLPLHHLRTETSRKFLRITARSSSEPSTTAIKGMGNYQGPVIDDDALEFPRRHGRRRCPQCPQRRRTWYPYYTKK